MKFFEVHGMLDEGKVLVREGGEFVVLKTRTVTLKADVAKHITGTDAPLQLMSALMTLNREGEMRPFTLTQVDMAADDWKAIDLRAGETVEDRAKHRGMMEIPQSLYQDFNTLWARYECGDIIAVNYINHSETYQIIADSVRFSPQENAAELPRYIMIVDEACDKVEFKREV